MFVFLNIISVLRCVLEFDWIDFVFQSLCQSWMVSVFFFCFFVFDKMNIILQNEWIEIATEMSVLVRKRLYFQNLFC